MNKLDLFQEKILHSGRHLRFYLPQFKGGFAAYSVTMSRIWALIKQLRFRLRMHQRIFTHEGLKLHKWKEKKEEKEVWKETNCFIFPQVQTVMWTLLRASWLPPSSHSTPPPANSSTTTSPRPQTPPTSRWCSRWWWTPSSRRTWRPCRCCSCHKRLWDAWKHERTHQQPGELVLVWAIKCFLWTLGLKFNY